MARLDKEKALEGYLVAAARTHDIAAMDRLIRLRTPRLMAHAVRLLGDRDAAHDVVQDAWIDIIGGLHRLRDTGAFLPWALRIVSRRVARVIKGRQKDRRLSREYAHGADTEIAPAGEGTLDAARVRGALAHLPPDQSATIALFYLSEMSVAEVAMAMDVPVGTVKTRLMHAREKLRGILEGDTDGKA